MADRRKADRRAVFFWISGLLSLLLVPLTPDDFKWVGLVLFVWLSILGLASWIDDHSRRRGRA